MARRRHRRRPAALVAVLLTVLVAGCSDDGGDSSTVTPIVASGDSAAGDSTTGVSTAGVAASGEKQSSADTTPASAPSGPAVPIDAAAVLQQALDAIVAGYHFNTSVTLNGAEVLVAEGDRVGDGTRLTIWANGGSIAYIITPAGSWVFPEGGEWQALDSPPATTDPLQALRAPLSVTGTSNDGGVTASIVATVSAATLGVAADGTADVQVVVNGTTLTEVGYTSTVDGQPTAVRSVFGPVADATPVTPPI